MQLVKKPLMPSLVVILLLAILASIDWEFANRFRIILIVILSFFSALLIHELGHLLGGLLTKSRFLKMVVGPFVLERNTFGKLTFHLNGMWGEAGGLVFMQLEDPRFKQKILCYSAGGPLVSLLFATLFFSDIQYLHITGLFCIVLFVTTIFPYNLNGLFSDGYTILQIIKNNDYFLRYYKMTNMLLSTKKTETWDLSIQEEAATIDQTKLTINERSIYLMFLFYSAVLTGKTSYLQRFYDKLDFSQIDQAHAVQQATVLHYVVATEFLLTRNSSLSAHKLNGLPTIDQLSTLRTKSIFEKVNGQVANDIHLYQLYLEDQLASSYSFLQVEAQFFRQYLL